MPRAAPLPCRHSGCANVVDGGGYCPTHAADAHQWDSSQRARARQKRRALATGDPRWRRLREVILREVPLCVRCSAQGRVRLATVVDHIDGNAMNNDRSNLQSLCASCHSAKTAREDGGFGNPRRR
ncbi:HNH endonuclease signature motif containing protein [Castellaniella sp.]|uniref:HNH endonuclease signature motif containing protein n=1 Tax=Castellaniella sp. TaxID=1955812 RepID=UPI003A8CCFB9